ncbi:MAG: PIG-L family deacetylase [Chloroflexi bacterium]|nr:PIG-L family deacetylase [Chloroflexota bacterium]
MKKKQSIAAALVVAHPDDETLWAGGTIIMHPDWQWMVVSLCRRNDADRRVRFQHATQELGATGAMGELDDGPEQTPLPEDEVQQTLRSLLPDRHFDLILTHSPYGEYTRHRRHEETSQAVVALWQQGLILTNEVWMFAYADSGQGGKDDPPRAIKTAHRLIPLPAEVWQRKYRIISDIYGFAPETYESSIVLREEAFWCFRYPSQFRKWLAVGRVVA